MEAYTTPGDTGYNAFIISTIVDFNIRRTASSRGYNAFIISTIVDLFVNV